MAKQNAQPLGESSAPTGKGPDFGGGSDPIDNLPNPETPQDPKTDPPAQDEELEEKQEELEEKPPVVEIEVEPEIEPEVIPVWQVIDSLSDLEGEMITEAVAIQARQVFKVLLRFRVEGKLTGQVIEIDRMQVSKDPVTQQAILVSRT